MKIPYTTLAVATTGFSKKLGFGGYAEVFKGVYEGKDIAVKKFYPTLDVNDTMFQNEFVNLQGVRHRNIVRSVGYCYETERDFVQENGNYVLVKKTYRMLCFEYLERGSLDDHISKESLGDNWCIHYQIIKGICEGLLYLHEECKVPIFHLDLKPANILLDKNMVPKLADFGLSRRFHEPHTHKTKNIVGTRKYMAPEFISQEEISCKNDVFSLGIIIIEVMAGRKGYTTFDGMSSTQEHEGFVQMVCNTWRERFSKLKWMDAASQDVYVQQVKTCIEIAVQCVDIDKDKRPKVHVITDMLNQTETEILRPLSAQGQTITSTSKEPVHVDRFVHYNDQVPPSLTRSHLHMHPTDGQVCQEVEKDFAKLQLSAAKELESIMLMSPGSIETELIDIYPSRLNFPFELNKRSKGRLSISNKTDYDVQFFIDPKNYPEYIYEKRLSGIVRSHFTCAFHVVMKERKKKPPRDNDEFEIHLKPIRYRHLLNIQHPHHLGGRDRHVTLQGLIIFRDPDPVATRRDDAVLDDEKFGELTSIDVHPTEEWILMGFEGGYICIWMNIGPKKGLPEGAFDYKFIVTAERQKGLACHAVKFIVCRQWVVSGHTDGVILVHAYNDNEPKQLEKLKAHVGTVTSLAVHPTQPHLLSSSDDGSIKLWNWNEGWSCTREFKRQKGPVLQVAFNPRNASTFATVTTLPRTMKIWSIDSNDPVKIWTMKVESIAYFTGNDGCYMAISMQEGRTKILDVESKTYLHALEILDLESETSSCLVPASAAITAVACHPKHPIIVTGTSDGAVYLWNYTTYRELRTELRAYGSVGQLLGAWSSGTRVRSQGLAAFRLMESLWFEEGKVKGIGFLEIEGSTRLLIRYADRIVPLDVNWSTITGQQ